MPILSSPLQLATQLAALAALAVGASAVLDSGISEIDLIVPTPDTTYEVGANGRFPVVWAIHNSSLWRGGIAQLQYYLYSSNQTIETPNINQALWSLVGFAEDTQYLAVDVHLQPETDYRFQWLVGGSQCNSVQGFENGTLDSHAFNGWHFNFTTKAGAQTNFSSALSANCSDRTAIAYNIAIPGGCRTFDDVDPFPSPTPCDLQPDASAVANVTQWLNDQFNHTCGRYFNASECSDFKGEKKSGGAQAHVSTGAMLLALTLVVSLL